MRPSPTGIAKARRMLSGRTDYSTVAPTVRAARTNNLRRFSSLIDAALETSDDRACAQDLPIRLAGVVPGHCRRRALGFTDALRMLAPKDFHTIQAPLSAA